MRNKLLASRDLCDEWLIDEMVLCSMVTEGRFGSANVVLGEVMELT